MARGGSINSLVVINQLYLGIGRRELAGRVRWPGGGSINRLVVINQLHLGIGRRELAGRVRWPGGGSGPPPSTSSRSPSGTSLPH